MKPNLAQTLITAALCLLFIASADLPAQATTLQQTAGVPVVGLLNTDGTLDLSRAPQGVLDLRGWDVQLDARLGPVFLPDLTGGGPWSSLGSGLSSSVFALLRDGNSLYAGGFFTDAGGDGDCDYICKWSGAGWSWPSGMGLEDWVGALAMDDGILYVGGAFENAGGYADCDRVGIWTGSAWDCPSGIGLNESIRALAHDGTNLYAGGFFTDAGGDSSCDYIGIWTGSAWDCPTGMALPVGTSVYALVWDGSNLDAGGDFLNAGGDGDCDNIGIWTGSVWDCPSGMGLSSTVYALAWQGNSLYAGDDFVDAGGDITCDYIGIWTYPDWDCPAFLFVGDTVRALALDGGNLYAAGDFLNASADTDCDRVGIWDGDSWDCPSGMSLGGIVRALALDGANLYAGGDFTDAGGDTDADYIGMFPLPWLFKDDFESGDMTAWSSFNTGSGNMTVSGACNLDGTYGLCLVSTNDKRKQMIDLVPADEKFYYGQFLLDPNGVDISGDSDRIRIFTGRNDATFPFIVLLRDVGASYSIRLRVANDSGAYTDTAFYAITDAVHTIGVEWKADTSDGAGDGYGALYVDGVLMEMQSGVDNDTMRVDKILLGITSRMDGMIFTGTMYMDAFYEDNNGWPE